MANEMSNSGKGSGAAKVIATDIRQSGKPYDQKTVKGNLGGKKSK